jgi:photosystem II stability/assembly factor-like uncharacterized protein
MKTKSIRIGGASLVLLLVCLSATTLGQTPFWVPTNDPYGGSITALVADTSGNIFAGTGRGIYRTADGGSTWTLSTRSVVPNREAFVVDTAGTILAGTYEGFWRSTDQGGRWEKTGLNNYPVKSLLVTAEGTLLAGLQFVTGWPTKGPGGVFRSTDGGFSWTPYGLQGQSVNDLLLSPRYGLIAFAGGIFRRTESDTSWTKAGGTGGYAICEDTSGNLFTGREVDGVRKSTDGGVTWNPTALHSDYSVSTLVALPTGEIYAGVVPIDPSIPGGAHRTTDGGQTWESLGLQEWAIYCMLALDSERLYLGSGRGVFRSTDGAATWNQANNGIAATEIGPLVCLDSVTVLAGTGSGMFRSTDNGQTWVESGTGIFPQFITCLAVDHKKNVFAGNMVFSPNGGIYKSTDGGLSWRCTSKDSIKGMYTGINGLVVTKENTLLAGVDGQGMIYRSADEGEHWTLVRRIVNARQVSTFAADSAGQVYGATWGDGVLRSTDDGISWLFTNPGLPNLNVSCLATRAANEVFVGGFWGVARSTTGGDSWTNISAGLRGAQVVALAVDSEGDLLASTHAGGVYRSTDDGRTWIADTAGLGGLRVHAFASSGGSVFATDTVRVYRSTKVSTAVSPQAGEVPRRMKLDQNYPNPFNPSTVVSFQLPVAGDVRLVVYDLLGREVSVLVNERRAAGVHEVKFDGSGLSSGMYFYRLRAGDFVATRKLVLLR